MKQLTVGMVLDIMTEGANDHEKYAPIATQSDMDAFAKGGF